jgi:hypothetical protein
MGLRSLSAIRTSATTRRAQLEMTIRLTLALALTQPNEARAPLLFGSVPAGEPNERGASENAHPIRLPVAYSLKDELASWMFVIDGQVACLFWPGWVSLAATSGARRNESNFMPSWSSPA